MAEDENLRRVNVAQLLTATSTEDAAVQQLRSACEETGFFLVTGHSLPNELLDRIFVSMKGGIGVSIFPTFAEKWRAVSRRFFELPEEEKMKHTSSEKTGWRGFNPFGSGQNCSLASKRPEVKETFYCGEPPSAEEGIAAPVEDFYQELRAYHSALLELSRSLLRGLSLALQLTPDHLEQIAFQKPVAKVLLARYPPTDEGDLSCGEHTDCGFLTLVCQDSSEAQGLQVRRPDGSWLSVKTDRYTPVANLGDLAARWTNDTFRSSWHRVMNLSRQPRFSVVFFNNMDEAADVECLESCVSLERPKKYSKITCGAYVAMKMKEMRTQLQS